AEKGMDSRVLETVLEYLFENDLLRQHGPGRYTVKDPRAFEATLDAVYACMAYRDPGHAISQLMSGRIRYGRDVVRSDKYDAVASATLTSKFSYGFARGLILRSGARSVLDIGCGTGQFLGYLAENGFSGRLYGMDQAEEAIQVGKAEQQAHANVQLFSGDALRLRESARGHGVDVVELVSFMFVMHEFDDTLVRGVVAGVADAFPSARLLLTELLNRTSDELRRSRETTVFPELKLVHRLSNQVLRDRDEWVTLLASCGYRLLEENQNNTANHVGLLFSRGGGNGAGA
ncbi:MAG TPA: class I SAM-dependent methyltransferase, partial [bacterium]|nr:class I SAM-dependent methyltransferase [bacterium]